VGVSPAGYSVRGGGPGACGGVVVCVGGGHMRVPMQAIPFTLHNFTYLTGCE
jgi:hypothetical protein